MKKLIAALVLMTSLNASADCVEAYKSSDLKRKERTKILTILDDTKGNLIFRLRYLHDIAEYGTSGGNVSSPMLNFITNIEAQFPNNRDTVMARGSKIANIVRTANEQNLLCPENGRVFSLSELETYTLSEFSKHQSSH